ncbi:MAG TPA: CRTAC1 family protein [Vicinamibacterales bacterium]|nr:CRTAC1 family protein [Vicinamibacterales bacterium]
MQTVRSAGIACAVALGVYASWAGVSVSGQSAAPFSDVTSQSGLDFVHVNGAEGGLLLPEVIGSGGALFDYDNDGDLDVFLVQGGRVPGSGTRDSGFDAQRAGSRLFRNDLNGTRTLRFTDVTKASGIVATGYGMGAATGDFDNDGWIDLYVTSLGPNQLIHNNGDGTFTYVTAKSGTDDPRWSTSATFFDYDRDGWLDLFVANYVNFRPDMKRSCFSAGSARDYCNPVVYDPVPDKLLHNNRNGTFSDVSARSAIARESGRGLGVMASDVNGDGWPDLYVANDGDPNQLWINARGSGSFADDALLAGVAVSRAGQPQGSMGIDIGDVDRDGDDDLFVTNLDNEGNTLYLNVGSGLFEDRTAEFGLFKLGLTGFGTRFMDYDNDGWLDLVVVNGAVRHLGSQLQNGDPYPLKQRSQLFRNDRGRKFVDVSDSAGTPFAQLQVARGAATGDLDNDGDIDLVVFNNSGPVRVLQNEVGSRGHWLGVRAIDTRYKRDAVQARVSLAGQRSAAKIVQTDGSYCVASDPRVLFGLGSGSAAQTVRVQWAGGQVEEFRNLAIDRYYVLEPGKAPRVQ